MNRGRLAEAVRTVAVRVVVDPVRSGRPRDVGWPVGLRTIVIAGLVVFVLGLSITATSGLLRSGLPLGAAALREFYVLPRPTVWLLLFMIVVTMALAQTAALHAPWWIRGLITSVSLIVLGLWGLRRPHLSYPVVVVAIGVLMVVLLGLVIVRAKFSFAWWEFPAVLGLLGSGMVLSLIGDLRAVANGVDLAPAFLQQTMISLGQLAVPVIFAAGLSVAEVTVSATVWTARVGQRLVTTPIAYAILAVGVVIWAGHATWQLVGLNLTEAEPGPLLAGVLPSVVAAVAFALVGLGVPLLGRRRGPQIRVVVGTLPEVMSKLGFPIGVGFGGVTIIFLIFVSAAAVILLFNPWGTASRSAMSAVTEVSAQSPTELITLLLALVIVIRAVRHARRTQPSVALLLGCVAVMLLAVTAGSLSRDALIISVNLGVINILAGLVLVVLAVGLAVRGRLSRQRAVTLTVGLVLSGLFSGRDFISDPVQAVLGFSGVGLAMFGLSWDLLTGSEWGNADGRRLLVPSRLMLLLANSTLGVTVLAYISLAGQSGGPADPETYSNSGNLILGTALIAATFITILGDVRADTEVV